MDTAVRRALVSTYDKTGVVDLCRSLASRGVEIVSTGGTSRLLAEAGIPTVSVPSITGFPEMLDGRVKTLHPRIHGGILGVRSNPEHVADLEAHGIPPIDLVVVNLYPFEEAARSSRPFDDVVEMIDVGGPAMVRAAAKNHAHVAVVVDPADYGAVLAEIAASGAVSDVTRRRLATKAFARTAAYDGAIARWLDPAAADGFPERLHLEFEKRLDLVYGENPHQKAAFYADPGPAAPGLASARQIQGKPLSFNNILDLDAALALARDLSRLSRGVASVIVKHGNPCGAACAAAPGDAFRAALACDPQSAFGGVIAFDRTVDEPAARAIAEAFYEAVVAPEFAPSALETLAKKKNLRLLSTGPLGTGPRPGRDLRRVGGGILCQDWDAAGDAVREGRVVTRRAPTEAEWLGLEFAWEVCRHVKSNAIVYAGPDRTLGIGAGQMSRVDSARIAVQKAQRALSGAVMASDAFFPFRDGLDVGADAGITAVVHPGGSIRDDEVIHAADERGLAMVLTGRRHFRH
jgi:phosphoribosylaminoimidazolecarboxamide formyltransferase/IMP cyclohydrolase